VVDDFERYARVCFEEFGDLVKFWFTINGTYTDDCQPDCIHANDQNISPEGDSQKEPYIVGHNLLLSHASAVKSFREQYGQQTDKQIGLVVNMNWGGPSTLYLSRCS
jgi:beta-glucosidase